MNSTFERKPYKKEEKLIKQGTQLVVTCSDLTFEGLGVCKVSGPGDNGTIFENFPLFVMGILPFEKGVVEINKMDKTFGYATIIKLFPDFYSNDRAIPLCDKYPKCGGCNIMHMTYDAQLRFKREMVKDTLAKIGGLNDVKVEHVLGMKKPFYYRNKVQIPFGQTRFKMITGFYQRDTHTIIPLEKCYIQTDLSTDIAKFVRNICSEYQLKGYEEKYHCGNIRHVLIKANTRGEIMLVLVSLNDEIPHLDEIVGKVTARYPQIKSVILNVNKTRGNTTLGNKNTTVYGDSYLADTLCGKTFHIGASSFYQVNHQQTEVLYQKAIEMAKLEKTDILIDAYCGIGTIGIIASDHVKYVYGVEIVEEAIKNAQENALLNDANNTTYVCGKAEEQIVRWYEEGIKADVIVVDPPRKGCDEVLLETIAKMKIPRLVYVSCNPATLARDLRFLIEKSYHIKTVQPVDMFPQSSHIETIVYLTLK